MNSAKSRRVILIFLLDSTNFRVWTSCIVQTARCVRGLHQTRYCVYCRVIPNLYELEKECFGPNRSTKILLLGESQLNEYWSWWKTEPRRMTLLPPTLVPKRRKPEFRADGTRAEWRAKLDLSPQDWVWLAVAVQPHTKGMDRSVRALRQFADARLLIVGLEEDNGRSAEIVQLARKIGVSDRIKWLGHHEDIPELMAVADVFVHPARYDTTGTVILEFIVNGLPVITTSACGYATHVSNADAGIVIQEPFYQRTFLAALETARDADMPASGHTLELNMANKSRSMRGRAGPPN